MCIFCGFRVGLTRKGLFSPDTDLEICIGFWIMIWFFIFIEASLIKVAKMLNVFKEICALDTIVQRSRSEGFERLEDVFIIFRRKWIVAKLVSNFIHKLCVLFDLCDGFSIEHPAVFLGVLIFSHFFIPENFIVFVEFINDHWVFSDEEIAEIAWGIDQACVLPEVKFIVFIGAPFDGYSMELHHDETEAGQIFKHVIFQYSEASKFIFLVFDHWNQGQHPIIDVEKRSEIRIGIGNLWQTEFLRIVLEFLFLFVLLQKTVFCNVIIQCIYRGNGPQLGLGFKLAEEIVFGGRLSRPVVWGVVYLGWEEIVAGTVRLFKCRVMIEVWRQGSFRLFVLIFSLVEEKLLIMLAVRRSR